MKLGWGWKITILYGCFAAGMIVLVVASSRQKFDLVSNDYYKDEIRYQDVIDAHKNMQGLSADAIISANGKEVSIAFPAELKDKQVTGEVDFYSPVNKDWDKTFKIDMHNNAVVLSRSQLQNTAYIVKLTFTAGGKQYYQQSELKLHS